VLVHGFPTASWDWSAIWPRLVPHYTCLAPDLIGYGFSAKPRAFGYSIGAQADVVEALLARQGIERYRLIAHDYGVSVAQELLARQREGAKARLVAVCLLNGGLFPETHRALWSQRLLASPRFGPWFARVASYRMFRAGMRRIWGATPPPEVELRAMWQLIQHADGMAIMPQLIGYMAERRQRRERWVGALVGAEVPIRLIDGLLDPVSGAHMVARYRELVARPDVVELPRVGHYPQLEAPEAVADAALEHLSRVESISAASTT
jgi:pimeloyl-ACP methyl ester carboxylesterase